MAEERWAAASGPRSSSEVLGAWRGGRKERQVAQQADCPLDFGWWLGMMGMDVRPMAQFTR